MRFRSVAYLIISVLSLTISIVLSKKYGGIGCAIANTIGLTIGQIVVMNIYYYKKIHIDVVLFWKEIGRMSFIPFVFCMIGFFIMPIFKIDTFEKWFFIVILFALIYLPLFIYYGLNNSEQKIFLSPFMKMFGKMNKI